MATAEVARAEDVLPVYSRVSWGALLAGLFVTLAVFVLLSTLGVAIGISSVDRLNPNAIAVGAGVWAVATVLIAFFCGGCVVSRCTTGESRGEAAIYGTILWGAAFAMIVWLSGSAFRGGVTVLVSPANATGAAPTNWEQAARSANLSDEQINRMRAQMPPPAQDHDASVQLAWWTFGGVLVSLLASIGGALAGVGPSPAFGARIYHRTTVAPSGA